MDIWNLETAPKKNQNCPQERVKAPEMQPEALIPYKKNGSELIIPGNCPGKYKWWKDDHAKKSRKKPDASFLIAHEWISQHRFELRAAGWTPSELYRRNKSRGIAWLKIWSRPDLTVSVVRKGEIVFRFKNTAGKSVQQAAFPRGSLW